MRQSATKEPVRPKVVSEARFSILQTPIQRRPGNSVEDLVEIAWDLGVNVMQGYSWGFQSESREANECLVVAAFCAPGERLVLAAFCLPERRLIELTTAGRPPRFRQGAPAASDLGRWPLQKSGQFGASRLPRTQLSQLTTLPPAPRRCAKWRASRYRPISLPMGDDSGFPTRPRAPHRRLHVAQLNPLQTVLGGFTCRSAFGSQAACRRDATAVCFVEKRCMHNDCRHAGRTVVLRIEPLSVSSCWASIGSVHWGRRLSDRRRSGLFSTVRASRCPR